MNIKRYHYVYRITNIEENKHYYGSRSTNRKYEILPKEEIGIEYFSSSNDKNFIEDQMKNPHKYRYKVIRIFKSRKDAGLFESKIHQKFQVHVNKNFYNRAIANSIGYCGINLIGIPKPKSFGEKVSKRFKGVPKPKEQTEKRLFTNMNTIDENGLNINQRIGIKSGITRKNTICDNGLSIAKNASKKMVDTKIKDVDSNGLNSFHRAAKKIVNIRKSKILDNGLSVEENAMIKIQHSKLQNIDEDGLNSNQRGAIKAANTMKNKIIDGKSTYQLTGEKTSKIAQEKNKKYNVYHISGKLIYENVSITHIRDNISASLRYKRSVDDYLAKELYIRNKFINSGKSHLIGLYIEEIKK